MFNVPLFPTMGSILAVQSSNTIAISNSVPIVDSVAIDPTNATVGTKTLTCSYGFSDADSDSDASDIAWTVDGALVGTSTTLEGGYPGGSVVVCTVTPNDATDAGTADSATLVIGNTPHYRCGSVESRSGLYPRCVESGRVDVGSRW